MKIYQLTMLVAKKDSSFGLIASSASTPLEQRYEYFQSEESANKRRDEIIDAEKVIGVHMIQSITVCPIEVKP